MPDASTAGSAPASAADPGQTPAAGAGTPAAAAPTPEQIRAQVRAELAAEHAAALKAATGHESIAALAAATRQAEEARLAEQGRYKELHEAASADLARTQADLRAMRVQAAIAAASADAVDAEVVHSLLHGQAQVAADGSVTIGGQPVAAAVAQLLKTRPYLARPAGGQGSGAGAAGGSGAGDVQRMSMRELADLKGRDPAAYQAEIRRRAGGGR